MKNAIKQLLVGSAIVGAALATSTSAQAGYYVDRYTTYEPVTRHQVRYVPEYRYNYRYQYGPNGYSYQYNWSQY